MFYSWNIYGITSSRGGFVGCIPSRVGLLSLGNDPVILRGGTTMRILLIVSLVVAVTLTASCSPIPVVSTSSEGVNQSPATSASPNFSEKLSKVLTENWAKSQVYEYLNDLAEGPEAIAYLNELMPNVSIEADPHPEQAGNVINGYISSGWTVYYRWIGGITKNDYWNDLSWQVCLDGNMLESMGALKVRLALLGFKEASTSLSPSPAGQSSSGYTEETAQTHVYSYLRNLATSPEAIRYLVQLMSSVSLRAWYGAKEAGLNIGGHKCSGWMVAFDLTSIPAPKPHWRNVVWWICTDGYVFEGSEDALLVKADILDLNRR